METGHHGSDGSVRDLCPVDLLFRLFSASAVTQHLIFNDQCGLQPGQGRYRVRPNPEEYGSSGRDRSYWDLG